MIQEKLVKMMSQLTAWAFTLNGCRKTLRVVVAVLGFSLILAGLPGAPSWAAPSEPDSAGTSMSLQPNTAVIQGCETVSVEVRVNNVTDLYGVDVVLAFEANVLEVVDADPTKPGVQVQDGSFLSPDFVVSREADNTNGLIQYALTQVSPSPPVSGSGVLFAILFKARSAAEASTLSFTQTDLVDLDGELLPVQPIAGSANTSGPASPALSIAKLSSANARLFWTASSGVAAYHLYRQTMAYFTPADPAYQITPNLSYDDLGVLGNPAVNYYYTVQSACANNFKSQSSNRVGEFDYALVPGLP